MRQMGYSIRAPAGSLFLRPFNGRLRYEGLPGSTTLESADVWADVPRELTTTGVKRLFDRLRLADLCLRSGPGRNVARLQQLAGDISISQPANARPARTGTGPESPGVLAHLPSQLRTPLLESPPHLRDVRGRDRC
ncbi:hypothetical protein CBM2634_P20033 [Cupriavidus taiwanensis]|uniref:Uncharacterized protein n=1 Tax=Cupriavidus taiwanensis TaxID=164546 RepID=A0A375JAW6_9BURK|nr:hypothetical protein CBM2634_P20033 [Cupriavidus taiwanensis]